MSTVLRYGVNSTIDLDLSPNALIADCRGPRGSALADLPAAVSAALAEPLDFPALRQSVVPGDRVAIALESEVPQAASIASSVISNLLDAGVAPADICIVRTGADQDGFDTRLRADLPETARDSIEIVCHDPQHRDALSYLAANHDGEPIYVNRRLVDADVVLPIGCLRLPKTPGYFGVSGTLYPTYSDAATIDRFRAGDADPEAGEMAGRRQEADETAWLLGVLLTIQAVPAAAGGVLHVIAGTAEAVERRGSELYKSAWGFELPQRAELVVAAIEGPHEQQTWENVGRAIAAASRAVLDDGAIALCTDLATLPGPALSCLAQARDLGDAGRQIRRQHSTDAAVAHELAAALSRGRVYLLSRLDESVVEDLGMAPVAAAADIARLVRRHQSCIVLGNAQFAQPTVLDEVAEQLR